MNSYMNIQIRVMTAQARRQLAATTTQMKALEAQTRRTNTASGSMAYGLPALSKWGNQVQWAGRQLQYNFTLPLLLAAGAATKFQLENEKAMVRVEKVYGDAAHGAEELRDEVDALGRAFQALSEKYGVQQSQVIDLAGDWAAAGASGLALAKSVDLTLQTMILGEMEAKEATEALIAVQAQYGQNTEQLAKTIDVLNMVENETGITMQGLIQGFARAAGVARSAGVDVQHLGAMLAALVPAAGTATNAGNALKTMISRLLAPTKEASQVLGLMGIEMDNTNWKSLNAAQRLEFMAEKYKELGEGVERNSRALDIHGKATGRMISSQQAIVSTVVASRWQINRWDVLMRDIARRQGYYQKSLRATADEQDNYTQRVKELNAVLSSNPQRLKQIWVIMQNAMTDVIQPLIPYIVWLAGEVAQMLRAFADLNPVWQKTILIGLAFLALIGPVARYIGSVSVLFGILSATVHWLGVKLGLTTVMMQGANGEIERQRRGLFGLVKSWIAFMLLPFRALFTMLVGGLRAVTLAIAAMPKVIVSTVALINGMGYAFTGLILAAKYGGLGMIRIFARSLGVMIGLAKRFGLWNLFAAMWQGIVGIFKSGAAASLGVQAAADSASVGLAAKSEQLKTGFTLAGAKARLGITGRTAQETLAIEAGATKAVEVNEYVAQQRRAAARAAWATYLVNLARSYNANVYGIEAGTSARLLALEAATGSAMVRTDSATTATRRQIHAAWASYILTLYRAMFAAQRGIEATAYGTSVAAYSAHTASMLAITTGWIQADLSARAAWVRFLVLLAQQLNAARFGIESAGATSRIAIEGTYQAQRTAIAGAGGTALLALEAGNSGKRLAIHTATSRSLVAVTATTAAAQASIWSRAWKAILAGAAAFGSKLGLIFARIVPLLTSPWGIAVGAAIGILYAFRDQIEQVWNNITSYFRANASGILDAFDPLVAGFWRIVGSLNDAFWALPEGVRNAMIAVVNVVRQAALEIYSWFSWMNPWQRHSPSLVESVETGMAAVKRSYASAGNVGGIFKKAAGDLRAFKKIANSMGSGEWSKDREDVSEAMPKALPLFDALVGDLRALNGVLARQAQAVKAQEAVVERWSKKLDRANNAVDRQRDKVDALRDKLQGLQDQYAAHEQKLQEYASAPIKGMGKMEDAIFANEMAQKKLRLEMLKFEEANGSVDDLRSRLAQLQGDIDTMRGRAMDLRAAGAGSDILGPIEAEIAKMEAQARALQKGADTAPLEKMQSELDKLAREGEILDLEKAIKYDPMLREIDKLANAQKELSFDAIINGINRERAAMEALQPKIDNVSQALERQEGALDRAEQARDRVQAGYDREAAQLDRINEKYRETEQLIREIEEALRTMGSASSEKLQEDAAKKKKKAEEYLTPGAQAFKDAAGGGFPDPGMDARIGREKIPGRKLWDSQADLIDQFTKDIAADTGKMFGDIDIFGPLKKWWSKTWAWIKENLGPVFAPIVNGIKAGAERAGQAWENFKAGFGGGGEGMFAGLGERARGAFDGLVGWLRTAWDWGKKIASLFGPDIRRIFDALVEAGKKIWNDLGPELAQFGDTFKLLWQAIKNVGLIALPILIVAFKVVAGIISKTLGPVLEVVIDVVENIIQAMRGLIDFVLGILAGNWVRAWGGMVDFLGGILGIIGSLLEGLWDIMVGIITGALTAVWEIFKWGWGLVEDQVSGWWDGIKDAWSNIKKNVTDWWFNSVLQPIKNKINDWWNGVTSTLSRWWNNIKDAWKAIKDGVKSWWMDNVWNPVKNGITNWWDERLRVWASWWAAIKQAWSNIKSGDWWKQNVLNPIAEKIGTWWANRLIVWKGWWEEIKQAWSNIKSGEWWKNKVLDPIKDAITGAWKAIKDWFKEHGDSIVAPIRTVVNNILNVVNAMIRGLNKIADVLPGIDWNIQLIPQLARGGELPEMARRVMGGFKTNGARAIVGEGKANWPEYVIPTDPTYRNRARGLLASAADRLGMQTQIPQHARGGILGSIKDKVGDVKDWGKGKLDWIGEKIDQLASLPFAPFKAMAQNLLEKVKWKYGREATQSVMNQVFDWVTKADEIYKDAAEKMTPPGGSVPVPTPMHPGNTTAWKGGVFTNLFIAHMKKAEQIAGSSVSVMQGGFRPRTSYSGTSHQGDAVDFQVSASLIRAFRQVGIAAGDRTGLGNWAPHTHAIPGPGAGEAAGSAVWQWQDYIAKGGMNQPLNSTWGLSKGGIALARYGGVQARLAEAGQDEAVIPLPRNWRTDIIGNGKNSGDGDTIIEINGNLEFPNIKTGEDAEVLIANLKSLAGGAA